MRDPDSIDLVLGTILPVALVGFAVSVPLAIFCISLDLAAELERQGKFRDYFRIIPPLEIVKREWRWIVRIRDACLLGIILILSAFLARSAWDAFAGPT